MDDQKLLHQPQRNPTDHVLHLRKPNWPRRLESSQIGQTRAGRAQIYHRFLLALIYQADPTMICPGIQSLIHTSWIGGVVQSRLSHDQIDQATLQETSIVIDQMESLAGIEAGLQIQSQAVEDVTEERQENHHETILIEQVDQFHEKLLGIFREMLQEIPQETFQGTCQEMQGR
jgi:hypothetical protein